MAWDETAREEHERRTDRYETDLADAERAVPGPLIPPQGKTGRPRELDMRDVMDAIQYIPGTGRQRRAVPDCFPALRRSGTALRLAGHGRSGADAGCPAHPRAPARGPFG